jgi:hypothetical protein
VPPSAATGEFAPIASPSSTTFLPKWQRSAVFEVMRTPWLECQATLFSEQRTPESSNIFAAWVAIMSLMCQPGMSGLLTVTAMLSCLRKGRKMQLLMVRSSQSPRNSKSKCEKAGVAFIVHEDPALIGP